VPELPKIAEIEIFKKERTPEAGKTPITRSPDHARSPDLGFSASQRLRGEKADLKLCSSNRIP
jgi:hypothetical protein